MIDVYHHMIKLACTYGIECRHHFLACSSWSGHATPKIRPAIARTSFSSGRTQHLQPVVSAIFQLVNGNFLLTSVQIKLEQMTNLCMACAARANGFVCWIRSVSTGVTHAGGMHTFLLPKLALGTPKTKWFQNSTHKKQRG